ncbi:PQQ-dependent sugar dehydrogenase [Granulicoccus sp. GXG6511]|uniref:PQQ-dependent sugar dehydrogenase n=1 Tax=Granulicoccus sp. GXG6511 TaxID=3381351 RepID=UPI003D7C713A
MIPSLRTRIIALLATLVCTLSLLAPSAPTAEAAPVPWAPGETTIAGGLHLPWGIVQLDDGSVLVTSSDSAEISRVTGDGQRRVVGTVPNVQPLNEGGLLGLVRDPENPRVLFAYASTITETGNDNRIWRLTWDGGRITPDRVILSGIPHGRAHSGGQLKFGPDGYLYVTTGDTNNRATAQDLRSMAGKILRIDRDGAAAPGNPFAGRPGLEARIWSYGHRNVQGIDWDSTGRMWASEFGQNAWDELNRIERGRNYGWPLCEGNFRFGSTEPCSDPAYTNPVHTWRPADASPSGLTVVGRTVLIAGLRGQSVWAVPTDGGTPTRHFTGRYGRIRTLLPAADGRLFVVTSNGNNADRILLVDARALVPGQHPTDWAYAAAGAGLLGVRDGGPWCGLARGGCFSRYEKGSVYWSPATGAQVVRGAVRDHWGRQGWEAGFLGYPTGDTVCGLRGEGCFQTFQGGSIYWSPATGGRFTRGLIRDQWAGQGWESGLLGYPTTDEICGLTRGGCFQHFQGGSIYWSPATGARFARGAIRDKWARMGWERSFLGYPVTSEICGLAAGGCFQRFQGGTIYWSPATGAQFVRGAIQARFAQMGAETGVLRYPTGDEACGLTRGGCFQTFQNGSIYWSPASGAQPVRGALRDTWARSGWENGRWGYPTGEEACEPGHCWQPFQGGMMHLRW